MSDEAQKPKKLTPKQRVWAEAYITTLNKTEASRRAGYKGNDSTMAHVGWENLTKPYIKEYVESRLSGIASDDDIKQAIETRIKTKSSKLYLIGAPNGLVKIGITTDIYRRLRVLDLSSPVELNLILSFESSQAEVIEAELHKYFAVKRVKGEWFNLSDSDLEWVKNKYVTDR